MGRATCKKSGDECVIGKADLTMCPAVKRGWIVSWSNSHVAAGGRPQRRPFRSRSEGRPPADHRKNARTASPRSRLEGLYQLFGLKG